MCKVVSTVPRERFKRYEVDFPSGWEVTYLNYPLSDEEFIKACDGADFLFVMSTHEVSRNVIANSPSLRMLHVEGVGYDKVDFVAATEFGLPVCNNRAVNNVSVAEHTVGLIISGLRRFALADHQLKRRDFLEVQSEFRRQGVRELFSRHIGLIGMGAIGQEVARMLAVFGCRISYYDLYRPTSEHEQELNISYLELDKLLQECEIISLHVPALPETINMIGARELASMKRTALLINTSRGELVNQVALAEALENGEIYGAAIDTVSPEPPPRDHPLLTLSSEAAARLILTPHVAGTTDEAFTRMLTWAISNMQDALDGALPKNIVNGVKSVRKMVNDNFTGDQEALVGNIVSMTRRFPEGNSLDLAMAIDTTSKSRKLG